MLGRQIGEGGMACVFEAVDRETGDTVAVKRMRLSCVRERGLLTRFQREIMVTSLLDHPHCARVLDRGTGSDGVPFFVMPRLQGMSLDECFLRPLPTGQVVALGTQILAALCHIHALGVAHRDIKPENIFLSGGPGQLERAVVIDFGLAKFLSEAMANQGLLTIPGTVMGTPGAMSPEQIRADEVDHRTDLYGLGIVMYTLLAGHRPFGNDDVDVEQMLRKQVYGEYAKLPQDVHDSVRDFVDDLLTPDPANRPLSAEAASVALIEIQRVGFNDRETWHDLFAPPVSDQAKRRFLTEISG